MDDFLARLNQPLLNTIISLLPQDVPVYLVGGAIRDGLLNRTNYDLDFVTPGDAMKIARQVADRLGAAYFPLDKKRNVARLIVNLDNQLNKSGKKTVRIDFSRFQGPDLTSDLQGRDFTMNAMAAEVHQLQTLIDPLHGGEDLFAKRLRTCAPDSLLNDPVRILRAVRFSVDLNLNIPAETLQFIRKATVKLNDVSPERLRDELFRILCQAHPATSLRILDRLNALAHVLPELGALKGVQQSPPHIMDVWEHTLDTINSLEELLEVLAEAFDPDRTGSLMIGMTVLKLGRFRDQLQAHLNLTLNPERPHRGILFLAGLYHDVGKPKSQKEDETGKIRFIEHEHIGRKVVEERGKLLKLSNLEIERLGTIVGHHMRPSLLSHDDDKPSRKAIYRFFRDTGAAGVDICLLSLADVMATYGSTLRQERWLRHLDVIRELLGAWWEDHASSILPAAYIDGSDLMRELELPAGPTIGFLLESLREAQVLGEIKNREEAINKARKLIEEVK